MTWSAGATADKYRTKTHRNYRASLVQQLERDGYLICTATMCLFDSRDITNAHGNDPDGLHAGHADNGVDYAGPQHRECNVRDGAVRGNRRSRGMTDEPRRWAL